MIASVLGASSGAGFSTRSATATTSPARSAPSAGATQPYLSISVARHVDQAEHDPAVLGVDVEHGAEQLVAVVDQIVGQQHRDRLAAGERSPVRDGVAEAARLLLLDLLMRASSVGRRTLRQPASSPFASSAASRSDRRAK